MSKEVMIVESLNPIDIYAKGGLDPILERIASEARSSLRDISTEAGRKEIASLAYKIARSKTFIDEAGKKLGEEAKAKLDAINADRKKARDSLDALKEEIRKPLTDWEEAEKQRVADHESDLAMIVQAGRYTLENWQNIPVDAMRDRLKEIENDTDGWEEFEARAKQAKTDAASAIRSAIDRREKHDAEQAELEAFRKAEAERLQRERDERLKAEAAQAAKREAEEKAAREAKAAAEKAEAVRLAVEREKQAAEAKAAAALAAQKAAEEKAVRDAQEALQRAEREKEAAIQRERDRVEAERAAEAQAAAKREADKKHRAKVNSEALKALVAAGLTEEQGRTAVEAIVKGQVPNIRISY